MNSSQIRAIVAGDFWVTDYVTDYVTDLDDILRNISQYMTIPGYVITKKQRIYSGSGWTLDRFVYVSETHPRVETFVLARKTNFVEVWLGTESARTAMEFPFKFLLDEKTVWHDFVYYNH